MEFSHSHWGKLLTLHCSSFLIKYCILFSYSNWIVDKVIGQEIYQNIGSSLLAIFFTVLIFLGSLRCSLMVILCVGITIVEVAGFLHFWGLTLDVISCNTLVIAVGLCVDFSVHIAHRFLSIPGDRSVARL